MTTVSDVIGLMDELAPPELAESWDNPGLQLGSPAWPVQKIMVALDALPAVVADACEQDADLLITHHPFIFKALKQIDYSTPQGQMIELATRHRLAVFSAHTNLDWASGGLNDAFAEAIDLKNVTPLASLEQAGPGNGLGRIGEMETPTELAGLARSIKTVFGISSLRITGALDMPVRRAAICTGSGSGLLSAFFESDAQVFISGDLRYHDARDAELYQRALIDLGHFASEHLMVDLIRRRLGTMLARAGHEAAVLATEKECDPFVIF